MRRKIRPSSRMTAVVALMAALAIAIPAVAYQGTGFTTWDQGFDAGTTTGWITDETAGPEGWCGDIELVAAGDDAIQPSEGSGHAVVSHGMCNDFWHENGFADGSGPYSFGAGFSATWPGPGFAYELDVYLDPAWDASTSFTLAAAFNQPALEFPTGLRYLMVTATGTAEGVSVHDHELTEAGWYTFRYVFSSSEGDLAVVFQMKRAGEVVYSTPLTTTALSGESISDFAVEDVGSGYLWFVALSPGLDLPIDEHRMRMVIDVDVPAGSDSFADDDDSMFERDIEWLATADITRGCSPSEFCPQVEITRGQMAAFLNRALNLPATTTDFFVDDDGSIFEDDINRLAAVGITRGCGPDSFCVHSVVTRGEMAAFLNRALSLPATTTDFFVDDDGSIFEDDINRLAAFDITEGCGPDSFCPDSEVTRGQMAAFIRRALG
jgi:hypothetical protein